MHSWLEHFHQTYLFTCLFIFFQIETNKIVGFVDEENATRYRKIREEMLRRYRCDPDEEVGQDYTPNLSQISLSFLQALITCSDRRSTFFSARALDI